MSVIVASNPWGQTSATSLPWRFASRRAADGESISLVGDRVRIEHRRRHRVERAQFCVAGLGIESAGGQGPLVELSGEGRRVCVGRRQRADLRVAAAQELRRTRHRSAGSAAGSSGLYSGSGT